MEVVTLDPALSELRRQRLNELLSNHNAYCEPPCHYACPAGIDIPAYIAAIARGDDAEAVRIVKERLPLPRIIGRVCPRPCESACRRTQVDGKAVAICQLKRFAADELHGDGAKTGGDHGPAHGQEDSRGGQWPLRPQRRLLSGPRRPPGDHLRGPGTAGRHGPARHPTLSAPPRGHRRGGRRDPEPGGRTAAEQPTGGRLQHRQPHGRGLRRRLSGHRGPVWLYRQHRRSGRCRGRLLRRGLPARDQRRTVDEAAGADARHGGRFHGHGRGPFRAPSGGRQGDGGLPAHAGGDAGHLRRGRRGGG